MSTAHVYPATIGLPTGADLYKWSVIASDQFSASPAYWKRADEIVGASPSTLRLMVPEVYLTIDSAEELQERVAATWEAMRDYRENVLTFTPNTVIYVERKTPHVDYRRSLVLALDLETYSYTGDSSADVRASEATVLERIPAREVVRRDASIELPHVQVLYDDPENRVLSILEGAAGNLEKLYETELMLGGGSVAGWRIDGNSQTWTQIKRVLDGLESKHGFRFIVGDGNHSLAAAKSHWEKVKAAGLQAEGAEADAERDLEEFEVSKHPARYALVELLNVHDEGLTMEPIHRWLRGISPDQLQEAAAKWNDAHDGELVSLELQTPEGADTLSLTQPGALIIESVQEVIDALIDELALEPSHACEYIHGSDELSRLVSEEGGIGITLPALDRSSLFDYVAQKGAMPRKSFSLGEAEEKRYYLETRVIVND
ncbi:MAG: DUF1015 domain-containing protein [Actinomycetaceae bacterium]|nr:DUF1015 domain-containing protein [Actinomycetaceae bacterium]